MKKCSLSLLVLLLILSSCNSSASSNAQKIASVKLEIEKLEQLLSPQIEELKQQSNSIQIQGRALSQEEMDLVDDSSTLLNEYETFKQNLQNAETLNELQKNLETLQSIQDKVKALLQK